MKGSRYVGALMVVVVAASVAWWRRVPPRPEPRPLVVERAVTVGRPATDDGAVLGVNEGLALPDSPFALANPAIHLGRRATFLRGLSARWARLNSHLYPSLNFLEFRDFEGADEVVRIAGAQGLRLLIVIGPWPGSRTGAYTGHYLPHDLAAYAAWVQRVVERYDGDTIDDMPGLLAPVRHWEVDNEPDLHNQVVARGDGADGALGLSPAGVEEASAPGEFQTAEEYATVLLATSAAIRRADPGATVLSAGFFRPASPEGTRYLRAVFSTPGAREAVDAVAVHAYTTEDSLRLYDDTLASVDAILPSMPVWVTETSVPSRGGGPWIDEDWQARQLAGALGVFLAGGVTRVFWHALVDAPESRADDVRRGFRTNSLMRVVGSDVDRYELKPAGKVFTRLSERLLGGPYREVTAEGGRVLEAPGGWLVFEGTVAGIAGGGQATDLLSGAEVPGGAPLTAPAWVERAP